MPLFTFTPAPLLLYMFRDELTGKWTKAHYRAERLHVSYDAHRCSNSDQEHEVRFWSQKLGVTPDELRQAVKDVGPMAAAVEQRLHGKGAKRRTAAYGDPTLQRRRETFARSDLLELVADSELQILRFASTDALLPHRTKELFRNARESRPGVIG